MTDGWVFLAISTAVCVGAFLNGLRFSQMDSNPWTWKSLFGLPVSGGELPVAKVRRIGLIQMAGSVFALALITAVCFGLLGPVDGLQTIELG